MNLLGVALWLAGLIVQCQVRDTISIKTDICCSNLYCCLLPF